jgi:hypothetical protein
LVSVFTSEAEAEAFALSHTGPDKRYDAVPAEALDNLGTKVYETRTANGRWVCDMIDTPDDAF